MLTLSVNLFTIFLCVSSSSFVLMWFFMEINLLTFVAFLNFNYCKFQAMSSIKYFCVQALLSVTILLSFLMMVISNFHLDFMLVPTLILVKLGAAPFQAWFISVMAKISNFSLFWLSTFQKVIPLFLLSLFFYEKIWLVIMISSLTVPFLAVKQTSIKKLFAYSSVFSINWLAASMTFSNFFWFLFLFCYSMVFLGVLLMTLDLGLSHNVKAFSQMNLYDMGLMYLGFLVLMGIPPMAMFFMKLKLLISLTNFSSSLALILILGSVVLMYMYSLVFMKLLFQFSFYLNTSSQKFSSIKKSSMFILILMLSMFIYTKKN